MSHEGHGGAAIVEHGRPGGQDRALGHRAPREAAGGRLDDLQVGATLSPIPSTSMRRAGGGGEHLGEGAEAAQQLLGDRLDVAARDRAEQHELQQLVIGQRVAADLGEAGAQAVAVAVVVRRVVADPLMPAPLPANMFRRDDAGKQPAQVKPVEDRRAACRSPSARG